MALRSWPGSSDRPLHPPGRDVRCIVSVGMLTEGWDCNTVTHIVGLRPFMSQLLCEQVVGRGLRRASYEVDDESGLLREEVAKVFGVPFEVIPFKANPQGPPPPRKDRRHVYAVAAKAAYEIRFPRVEKYTTAIRNRVAVDWDTVPKLIIDPGQIPPEVEMKGLSVTNQGRPSLTGPGRSDAATLAEFRERRRLQELIFDFARALTREYVGQERCDVPAHVLFPQLVPICERYVRDRVVVYNPADRKDLFCSPYFGWVVERLAEAIRPDTAQGEAPEVPMYETGRGPGSTADVDFWTSKEVREVVKVAPQLRGGRHPGLGAAGRVLPRHPQSRGRLREEPGTQLRDPVPAQRPRPRILAGFPRPAQDRPAPASHPGDQGLRPARGGQAGRRRAMGRGSERRRHVWPLVLRRRQEDDGGQRDHRGGMGGVRRFGRRFIEGRAEATRIRVCSKRMPLTRTRSVLHRYHGREDVVAGFPGVLGGCDLRGRGDRADARGWRTFVPSEPRPHGRGHHGSRNRAWVIMEQTLCDRDEPESDQALHLEIHRTRRSRPGPDLRERHDGVRGRAMGPSLDHDRHEPRPSGVGLSAAAHGDVPVLSARRREARSGGQVRLQAEAELQRALLPRLPGVLPSPRRPGITSRRH